MGPRPTREQSDQAVPSVGDEVLESLSRFGRGDRALSLLDQVERDSLDLDLAAWLVAQVADGVSFLVGARPGKAGKTTTMRSLLSFVPAELAFAEALPGQMPSNVKPSCVISHELSSHGLPAYLWDQDVRDFFALPRAGHMVAANLHADDLDETRGQICGDNGVPAAHFRAVPLLVYLRMDGKGEEARRWIEEVALAVGGADHVTVFTRAYGFAPDAPRNPEREAAVKAFLESAVELGFQTPPELRQRFLASGLAS